MQETVINVKIANRSYPITTSEGAGQQLLKASQHINQMLDELKNNYAVRDLQDLLAMCCLELANKQDTNVAPAPTPAAEAAPAPAALPVEAINEIGDIERRISSYLAG